MKIELYRGSEQILAELQIDPETGEVGEGVALEELVKRNPIGCIAHIKHTMAENACIKAREDELAKARKANEKRVERIEDMLKEMMRLTGAHKLKSPDDTFGATFYPWRDKSVEIVDEKAIPPEYTRLIPESRVPDKTLIRNAEVEIPGARIVLKDRLTIK